MPEENTLFNFLLKNLGKNIFEIFTKSLISFLIKAISALSSKKSEVIKDLRAKNKSIFDKLI